MTTTPIGSALAAAALVVATFSGCGSQVARGGALVEVELAPRAESAVDFGEVADFTLVRHDGVTIGRSDLEGRTWIVASMFTRCPSLCPRITRAMVDLQRQLLDTDVLLVSISVDPLRDDPETLTRYAEQYGADPDRWWFLTGDETEIQRLLQSSFHMAVAREPHGPTDDPSMAITHSDRLVVVDGEAKVRGLYQFEKHTGRLVERARRLAGD